MSRTYFGTDGVRGPYGGPVINESFAARLASASARWAHRSGSGRVVIGRDTRSSGLALERAVARGLRAGGVEPVLLGILPTPAVARAVHEGPDRLGVMITASHNPASDNGIKFFGPHGVKLTDDDEAAIEALLGPPVVLADRPLPVAAGARAAYIARAQAILPSGSLAGWKIVLDTANGATCETSPAVLRALGADVWSLGDQPDGDNINAGVGSEFPAQLGEKVRAAGAQIGIAHDGDGDRCLLCDEHGEILDGDAILTILALHALSQRRLARDTLVITVQSNLGVDAAVAAHGGKTLRTSVGDRYVIQRMAADGLNLGGESSGHIICADVSPTGDGLVAALKVIAVMLATGRPLSELSRALQRFPQLTAALRVQEKRPLATLPRLSATIRSLETELGNSGRVLVRYSGTEAKLRLLVEGPTESVVQAGLARLDAAVRAELTVL